MLQRILYDTVDDIWIESSTFPTWDELVSQFWSNSKHVTLGRFQIGGDLPGGVLYRRETTKSLYIQILYSVN